MHLKFAIVAFAFILVGCNSNSTAQSPAKTSTTKSSKETPSGNWEKLVMTSFRDNKGALLVEMPFPASWKMATSAVKGAPSITGPNGLKITDYPAQNFMYTNDYRMQQVYYQSGQALRAWPGIDAMIQQDIQPWGSQQGLQFVKSYEIAEVTKMDQWYNDQLFKAVPGNTEVRAIGSEWQSANGTPYFLLMHIVVSETANLQMWYYYCSGLQADKSYFELAKKQYIFSLANAHYALEPIMAYNQQEAEKAGKSWAAFNQRMAQNQAAFEAGQREHVNRTNAINDAIMNGWRANNAASDKNQEQFIDAMREETKVSDQSGKQYKVESHYNHYWMNSNGEYISTNYETYNPNLDENMNNQKWEELKKADY
ncbi:MAG: hypothetical protein U0V74_05890 [Chitinophagales bacterium]